MKVYEVMRVLMSHLNEMYDIFEALETARRLEEWHEDYGDAPWWKFPIAESPYCGTPLDCSWTDGYTHWTPLVEPEPPKG
mgnify:CR=1 FL=1